MSEFEEPQPQGCGGRKKRFYAFLLILGSATLLTYNHSAFAKPKQRVLYASDLRHGEKQVADLVHDRPEMAKFVTPGDPIWHWAVINFAGSETGYRIYWENTPTQDNFAAEHQYQIGNQRAVIRMQTVDDLGRRIGGEEQWTAVVYELFNIRSDKKFYANWKSLSYPIFAHAESRSIEAAQ
jgi:hypothetical protein